MGNEHIQHVAVPGAPGTGLVVFHAQMALAFFEALFNWPAHQRSLVKFSLLDISRSIAEGVFYLAIFVSADVQPDFLVRKGAVVVCLSLNHPEDFHLGHKGAFGSLTQDFLLPGDVLVFGNLGYRIVPVLY